MTDGPNVQVTVEATLDSASAAAITGAVGEAGTKGAQQFNAALNKALNPDEAARFAKELASGWEKAQAGAKGTATQVNHLQSSLTDVGRSIAALATELQNLGHSDGTIRSGVIGQTEQIRRASIEATTAVQSAAKQQTAIVQSEAAQANIAAQTAGQKQVIAARTSGQERVAIVRGIVDTIGRLEKGLGVTLAGIARTATSAFSKGFSGIGSAIGAVFRRGDSEAFEGTNSALRSELNTRESIIKSSMRSQESVVRESLTRQEKTLTSIRTSTQSGLLGAANNRGLFAGIGASLGLGLLAKSTFTVGADFVRGLAVLQASLGLTDATMKKVRQTSIDLGNDISLPGVSALDAAQAIQVLTKQFGSLGPAAIDAAQAAAKGTLQLARATGSSAEDAGALVGSAVNVFGIAATDASSAADKITGALTRAAGVSFSDFKDSFTQGAAVFEQFVGPTESANDALLDFNTTLAILAKNGITGSNAGAGLKQFFIQATQNTKSATNASKELATNAGEVGNVFFDANGKLRPFNKSIDILRKGVAGLSDQAKTNLLGDLFGSRSITIANALINSTGQSFEDLRNQIAQQGIAAKIAAAQNTGLKGAFDALSSVAETLQIVFYESIQKPLGAAVLAITSFANTIFFGAGPALKTLRFALIGVAGGITAILGLKVAIELIALLGRTIALALTPFGALVLVFAGVGAALGVLAAHGVPLTKILGDLKDRAVELGERGLDFIVPKLAALRDLFTGTIIPAAERLAEVVGHALVVAFHATVDFVKGEVIPALQTFASFITGTVVPAAINAGTAIGSFATNVIGSIVDLAQRIQPVIQPLLSGFADLGRAIGSAFTGNFGDLGSGLASAGSGIAQVAVSIGQNILTALAPIAAKVADFFKSVFTLANLGSAVDAVGTFLNFIGEKVGAFVSNPVFLATVGTVAGALALVAAKWAIALATGLGEGLASNIPRILGDMGSLLFDTLLSPENLLKTVAITSLIVTIGRALVLGFRAVGATSGESFGQGFSNSIKNAPAFASGLFGGPSSAFARASQKTLGDLTKGAQDVQNQLRALGVNRSLSASDPLGLKNATDEVRNLKRGLTDAQVAGLELRDKLSSAFRAVGGVVVGGGSILTGLAQIPAAFGTAGRAAIASFREGITQRRAGAGGATFIVDSLGGAAAVTSSGQSVGRSFATALSDGLRAATSTIKGGISGIFGAIKTYAAEQNISVGKTIASGLAGAIAAATAGIATGSQLGSAHDLTSTLLGAGGLAGASLAIGAVNPAAGVATLGIGLLTAALTRASEKGKQFRADIDNIKSSLAPGLADAAKSGQLSIDDLKQALTIGDLGGTDAFDSVLQSIIDGLGGDAQKKLHDFGISFNDAFSGVLKGGGGPQELTAQLIELTTTSGTLATKFGANATLIQRALTDITAAGGPGSLNQLLATNTKEGFGFTKEDIAVLQQFAPEINDIVSVSDKMTDSFKKNAIAVGEAGDKQFAMAKALGSTDISIGVLPDSLASMATSVAKIADNPIDFLDIPTSNSGAIASTNNDLQAIIDKKNAIDQLFADGVLPSNLNPFTDQLQKSAIGVEGLSTTIQGIFDNGGKDFLTSSKVTQALEGFGQEVTKALGAGIKNGDIIDQATAEEKLQPILDAALAGVSDEGTKQAIRDAFKDVIVTLQPVIGELSQLQVDKLNAEVKLAMESGGPENSINIGITPPEIPMETSIEVAQAVADANPLNVKVQIQAPGTVDGGLDGRLQELSQENSLKIQATIDSANLAAGWAGEAQALVDGAAPQVAVTAKPLALPTNFIPGSALLAAGVNAGTQLGQGLVNGINAKQGAVETAAAHLAAVAANATRANLQIRSPSKVFEKIGQFIGAGLVDGIDASADDVASSISDMVSKAIDQATGQLSDAAKGFRNGASDLFDAFFGSDNAGGTATIGGLQGGITDAFQSLASTLDSSISQAADVLARSATEALSRADLDVLGESGTSLNTADVLGSKNRQALGGALDSVVALAKEMISQGAPVDQVTSTLGAYTDRIRQLGAQYGLNTDQVNDLIDQYGLSTGTVNDFVTALATLSDGLGQTTTDADKLNATVVDLFKNATSGKKLGTALGVGAAETARAAVTTATQSIASALDGALGQLDAIAKATDPLTNAQRDVQGEDSRSLDFNDVLGAANRAAISSALSAIGDLGTSLLEGGSSAAYVTGEIQNQISALLQYTDALGFNHDQVLALASGLGLSGDALTAFLTAVQAAQTAATQGAAAAVANTGVPGANVPGLPPASNAPAPPTDVPISVNVNVPLTLPYGDPAAIGLAVGNRVATQIRLLN